MQSQQEGGKSTYNVDAGPKDIALSLEILDQRRITIQVPHLDVTIICRSNEVSPVFRQGDGPDFGLSYFLYKAVSTKLGKMR